MAPKKREWQFAAGGLLLVIALGLNMIVVQEASAQQSELRQQILAPDCSPQNSCQLQSPTIDSINKNGGRPIITGTYDAVFTENLVITFGGIAYTLRSSGELTAERGEWRLDLSALSSPLTPGEYELVVEAIGYDGQRSEARAVIILLPSDIKNDSAVQPDDPLVPKPISPKEPSLVPLGAVLALTAGSFVLYAVAAIRRNKRQDEN